MDNRSAPPQHLGYTATFALARILAQLLSLTGTVVVARILGPDSYGLIGMARMALVALDLLRDMGTATALIQAPEITNRILSSIFWLNLVLAGAATLLAFAFAPALGSFYRQPQAGFLLIGLSGTFLITAAGSVPSALLARDLRFREAARIEFAMPVAGTAVAIAAALLGAGAWSLVFSALASSLTGTVLAWSLSPFTPRLHFNRAEIRAISRFGIRFSGARLLEFVTMNADNAIVGRTLGATALGYYGFAYNLMLLPVLSISGLLSRILFPALAQMQTDLPRLREKFLAATETVALVTFPLLTAAAVLATPLFTILLGSEWVPAARVFAILAPAGILQILLATTVSLFAATGRADRMLRLGLVTAPVTVASFAIGAGYGIEGVAWGFLISTGALFLPSLAYAFRPVGLTLTRFIGVMPVPLAATAGPAITLFITVSFTSDIFTIAAGAVLGKLFYLLVVFAAKPKLYHQLRSRIGSL